MVFSQMNPRSHPSEWTILVGGNPISRVVHRPDSCYTLSANTQKTLNLKRTF